MSHLFQSLLRLATIHDFSASTHLFFEHRLLLHLISIAKLATIPITYENSSLVTFKL
jgi:hypothetical protein